MTPGFVLYVYVITNHNHVFPLFYQMRAGKGAIGPGCALLCKDKPWVEKPVLLDACIQVTIRSDIKDRLGSSEFRLIRDWEHLCFYTMALHTNITRKTFPMLTICDGQNRLERGLLPDNITSTGTSASSSCLVCAYVVIILTFRVAGDEVGTDLTK